MRIIGSKSSIILNLLLALFIGVIAGNFIGSRIYPVTSDAFSDVNDTTENIYLLQEAEYLTEDEALGKCKELKDLGHFATYIYYEEKYVVIACVGSTTDNLLYKQSEILIDGYNTSVIEIDILEYLLQNCSDQNEINFWAKSIEYYTKLLKGEKIDEFNSAYVEDVDNDKITFYNFLVSLNGNNSTELEFKLKILTFKYLIESIK